jgi:hypothetical protein
MFCISFDHEVRLGLVLLVVVCEVDVGAGEDDSGSCVVYKNV